jgi:hypothetical protein
MLGRLSDFAGYFDAAETPSACGSSSKLASIAALTGNTVHAMNRTDTTTWILQKRSEGNIITPL